MSNAVIYKLPEGIPTAKDFRIEQFERGKLLDIQVKWNKKYNPVAGRSVENVVFENIFYNENGEHTSKIQGFAEDRKANNS